MMHAPAATAAAITAGFAVSIEMAMLEAAAMPAMTGTTRASFDATSTAGGAGTSRLPPHIDDGRPFRNDLARAGNGRFDRGIAAAVGERIGRGIEDAHDDGPGEINDAISTAPLHELVRSS